jgi:hypothetical protein
VLSDELPDSPTTAESTSASVDNLLLVANGDSDMSAFAAAAITGGDGFRTMMHTWRYTLPAFLVPFAFVLTSRALWIGIGAAVVASALAAHLVLSRRAPEAARPYDGS